MNTPITRRRVLLMGTLLSIPLLGQALGPLHAAQPGDRIERLRLIEKRSGGRLGVVIMDMANGGQFGVRADERFPLCSTFKFLAAACVLARTDRGEDRLDRRIRINRADLVDYSPGTEPHVGSDMSLAELCDAALTLSDNTAGNLLLESFGGPAGLTDFSRSIGDAVTRLDRIEPELNEALPGDPRDTTTPAAMTGNLRRLLLGDGLSRQSRDQLIAWMRANKTGDARLRAGVPAGWRVADKTGSGRNGATNDIGLLWPPGGPPLIVAAYLAETSATPDARNAAIAGAAALAVTVRGGQ
jgi:beta-lactamase class A